MKPFKKATRWTGLAVILTALAVLHPITLTAQEAEDYAQQLAKGYELLEIKEHSAAIQAFRRANDLAGGTSVDALLGIAGACYQEKRYSEAIEAARELLALTENKGVLKEANDLLGRSLLGLPGRETADLEEAERAFRKVIELGGGGEAAPRLSLAIALRELGRAVEALATLEDLVSSDRTGPSAERARALEREIRGELEREIRASLTRQVAPEALGEPLQVGEEVTPPVKIYAPRPHYSAEAEKNGVQGVVIVQAIIDRKGRVGDVRVLQGLPYGLSEAAVKVVKQSRFKPATLHGEPVDVYYNLTVNFRLEARRR